MFQVLVPGCAWDTILLVARGGRYTLLLVLGGAWVTLLFVLVGGWGTLLLVLDDGGGNMYHYLNINIISSLLQKLLSNIPSTKMSFLCKYTPSIIRYKK